MQGFIHTPLEGEKVAEFVARLSDFQLDRNAERARLTVGLHCLQRSITLHPLVLLTQDGDNLEKDESNAKYCKLSSKHVREKASEL